MKTKIPMIPLAAIAIAAPILVLGGPAGAGKSTSGSGAEIDYRTANDAFQATVRNKRTPINEVSNAFVRVLSSTNLTETGRAQAFVDLGKAYGQRSRLDPAIDCFDKALAIEKAGPEARVRALSEKGKAYSAENFRGGYASYCHDNLDRAAETFLSILEIAGATGLDKVTALKDAAYAIFDARQEVDPKGVELLLKAAKLPGLTEQEKAVASLNLADYYIETLEFDKAKELLVPLFDLAKAKKFPVLFCRDVFSSYADVIEGIDDFDRVYKMMTAGEGKGLYDNRKIAYFCLGNDRPDLAIEVLRQDMPGPDKKPSVRIWFLRNRLGWFYLQKGFESFRCFVEKELLPLIEANPDEWPGFLGFLKKEAASNSRGDNAPGFYPWVLSLAMRAPAGKGLPAADMLDLAYHVGDIETAAFFADKIVKAGDPKAKDYFKAGLVLAIADSRNDKGVVGKVEAWFGKNKVVEVEKRGEAMLQAARVAMAFRHEMSARALYGAYEKMIVPAKNASLDCPFIENAPQEIGAIMACDFYKKAPKGKLDQKYGKQLQFLLETDSAVTGRKIADGKEDLPFPELFVFCDLYGVKFLINAYMSREEIAELRNGFGSAASYEAYLSPGIDSPYEFLFLDPPTNYGDTEGNFLTQYNNENGYRNLNYMENTIDVSYLVRDDSVVTMISVAWAPYFNNLPKEGSEWFFDPIIWTRGGLSWGGCESVHHRSSFGRIVFKGMTPAHRVAIKRRLIGSAIGFYRKAKAPRRNGQIEIWKDNELGDQDFYEKCIKPLCDRLDPYERMVGASMTDEEVELVYEKAARDWFNIEYVIAKLRRDYLDKKLTSRE